MSLILQPQNSFTVVRQIANHTDSTTYYVRAVIRNAYTDALIETLDLTDRGSQRFSKNWQVPADPSGQGFYISIVTSVYTDSGYTTKSENYGDEENTYLVQERVLGSLGKGGGLDARTLRRVIQEELEKLPKPEKPEPAKEIEMPEMRFGEVLQAITELKTALKAVPTKEADLSPVLSALEELRGAVDEKPVTPETDLSPAMEQIHTEVDDVLTAIQEVKGMVEALGPDLAEVVTENIDQALKQTQFTSTFTTAAQGRTAPKEKSENTFDVRKLAQ